MNVSNSKRNPIRPIGSDVTLTCTVDLNPVVDVQVTVRTVWNGPAQFRVITIAQPVMGSNTSYISTAMVSSFGRVQSGNYRCIAVVMLSHWSQFVSGRRFKIVTTKVTTSESTDVGNIKQTNTGCSS